MTRKYGRFSYFISSSQGDLVAVQQLCYTLSMNNKLKFSLALKIFVFEVVALFVLTFIYPGINESVSLLLGFTPVRVGIFIVVLLLVKEFWNNRNNN